MEKLDNNLSGPAVHCCRLGGLGVERTISRATREVSQQNRPKAALSATVPSAGSCGQPTQINLQVPDDATTGLVSVTITTGSGTATSNVTLSSRPRRRCGYLCRLPV